MPVSTYFEDPNKINFSYFSGLELYFRGWSWLALLAGPLTLVLLGRSAVGLFVAAAVLGYAIILRFPVVGIVYAAATYDEILVSPVRNMVFFIYLITGAFIYLIAVIVTRIGSTWSQLASLLLSGIAVYLAWKYGGAWFASSSSLFLLVLVLLYAGAIVAMTIVGPEVATNRLNPKRPQELVMFLLLSTGLAVATAEWRGSVLREAVAKSSEKEIIDGLGCRPKACNPSFELANWARTNLSPDNVLEININNEVFPSLVMPQRIVAWPGPKLEITSTATTSRFFTSITTAP